MTSARVWAATLLSPVAWIADLGGKLFLSRTVNATGRKLPLHLLTLVALALTLAALWLSRQYVRQGTALLVATPEPDRGTVAATRSLAKWGVGLALFFSLLVAAMGLPTFVFDPRAVP
jgi:hypothetical protein